MFIHHVQPPLTFLEGFGYVVVAETAKSECPRDLTVLLCHRLPGSEQRAKCIETDEEVFLGHHVMSD